MAFAYDQDFSENKTTCTHSGLPSSLQVKFILYGMAAQVRSNTQHCLASDCITIKECQIKKLCASKLWTALCLVYRKI